MLAVQALPTIIHYELCKFLYHVYMDVEVKLDSKMEQLYLSISRVGSTDEEPHSTAAELFGLPFR